LLLIYNDPKIINYFFSNKEDPHVVTTVKSEAKPRLSPTQKSTNLQQTAQQATSNTRQPKNQSNYQHLAAAAAALALSSTAAVVPAPGSSQLGTNFPPSNLKLEAKTTTLTLPIQQPTSFQNSNSNHMLWNSSSTTSLPPPPAAMLMDTTNPVSQFFGHQFHQQSNNPHLHTLLQQQIMNHPHHHHHQLKTMSMPSLPPISASSPATQPCINQLPPSFHSSFKHHHNPGLISQSPTSATSKMFPEFLSHLNQHQQQQQHLQHHHIPTPNFNDPNFDLTSYAAKLKREKLIDMCTAAQQSQQAAVAAVAAASLLSHHHQNALHHHHMPPMINVENVNFYGSLPSTAAHSSNVNNNDISNELMQKICAKKSSASNFQRHQSLHIDGKINEKSTQKCLNDQQQTPTKNKLTQKRQLINTNSKSASKKQQPAQIQVQVEKINSVVSVSSGSSSVKQVLPNFKKEADLNSKTVEVNTEVLNKKNDDYNENDHTDRKSRCSSFDSSVNLVVDETSMIVEQNADTLNMEDDSNQLKSSGSNECSKNVDIDQQCKIKEANQAQNNDTISDASKDIEKVIEKNTDNKTWTKNSDKQNELSEFKINYDSIKNLSNNCVVNLNDYVCLNSNKNILKFYKKQEKKAPVAHESFNELINESSNTNYSMDDESETNFNYVLQVKSIWIDKGKK
jgi:hypothetical protein